VKFGIMVTIKQFLGTFTKFQKATVNFIMFVCPFACLHVIPGLPQWTNFQDIFDIWWFFWKSVEKIDVSLKCDKNDRYFEWRCMYIYDNILLNSSHNGICSDKSCRANPTHILCPITFFLENRDLYDCAKVW
jgi:hypothetical protein